MPIDTEEFFSLHDHTPPWKFFAHNPPSQVTTAFPHYRVFAIASIARSKSGTGRRKTRRACTVLLLLHHTDATRDGKARRTH